MTPLKSVLLLLACVSVCMGAESNERTFVSKLDVPDVTYRFIPKEDGSTLFTVGYCSCFTVKITGQKEGAVTFKVTGSLGTPRDIYAKLLTSRFDDITNKTFTIFHDGQRVTRIEEVK